MFVSSCVGDTNLHVTLPQGQDPSVSTLTDQLAEVVRKLKMKPMPKRLPSTCFGRSQCVLRTRVVVHVLWEQAFDGLARDSILRDTNTATVIYTSYLHIMMES